MEWRFFSDRFPVYNGVKQDDVLSPILFCVYIDGLLKRLAYHKIGCNFSTVYVGEVAYANEIVLLGPTASAMRRMLHICDDYAKEFNILFNAKKSKCTVCIHHRISVGL